MDASSSRTRPRASPVGRPPRVLRSNAGLALGMALVAALDEPATAAAAKLPCATPAATTTPAPPSSSTLSSLAPAAPRPRSDSTLSSDTFDGIYALGDDDVNVDDVNVDDVDMDDLHGAAADAFRPSALLDRKLGDEFGDGRASDPLAEMLQGVDCHHNDEDPVARMACMDDDMAMEMDVHVDDDEAAAVMAHLARLDAQQQQTQTQTQTPAYNLSGFVAVLPPSGAGSSGRCLQVGGTGGVVVSASPAATTLLPPRAGVDAQRRVHKRTFGQRGATFRFASSSLSSPLKVSAMAAAVVVRTTTARSRAGHGIDTAMAASATAVTRRSARSLFCEAAEDIAGRRDLVHAPPPEKEDSPPSSAKPVAAGEGGHAAHESSSSAMPSLSTIHPEKEDEDSGTTGVRCSSIEPVALPMAAAPTHTPVRQTATTSASSVFQTPQRRCGVSTETASTDPSAFLTPVANVSSSSCSAAAPTAASSSMPPASAVAASISPTPTFDKVAVVHAKDTPGKVDKFEWTIRRGSRVPSPTPLTASTTTPTLALPPPYLRDTTTPKRRVHSSTFGSFARSFSFATSPPPAP